MSRKDVAYSSQFLAPGRIKDGLFPGACRQGSFLPAILLLSAIWGLNGILCAQPVADLAAAQIAAVMAARLRRTPLSSASNFCLSRAKEKRFPDACRQGSFLPAILLLPAVWGLNGILHAQPAADLAAVMAAPDAAVLTFQFLPRPWPQRVYIISLRFRQNEVDSSNRNGVILCPLV